MAEVYFRKNGTTYHLDYQIDGYPSQGRLGFKSSSDAETVPAMSTQGTAVYGGKAYTGVKVYYDTSSPTIAFRKNGTTYYCSKQLKYAGKTSGSIVSTSVSSTKLSTKFEYERHLVVVAFIPLISLFESIKHCDTIKERTVNIIIDIKVGIIPHF